MVTFLKPHYQSRHQYCMKNCRMMCNVCDVHTQCFPFHHTDWNIIRNYKQWHDYITYIIHVVKVKNNAVLLSYYKYILRLLLHFKQMFAHSSLVLLLIFTWRNFIIIWLRYLMYSSFLFWFKAGCPLDLTEGNFDNKKCISPNKADLFEGSVFLYGESYFKKNQSNINITLYNC